MYQTEHYLNNELHYISGVDCELEVLTNAKTFEHFTIYLN